MIHNIILYYNTYIDERALARIGLRRLCGGGVPPETQSQPVFFFFQQTRAGINNTVASPCIARAAVRRTHGVSIILYYNGKPESMSHVNEIDLLRARVAGRNRIPGPRRRHRRRYIGTMRRRRYLPLYIYRYLYYP